MISRKLVLLLTTIAVMEISGFIQLLPPPHNVATLQTLNKQDQQQYQRQNHYSSSLNDQYSFALYAKATGKKKKKNKKSKAASASSSGGFGKVEIIKSNNGKDKDFEAFPALESSVKETLVPSTEDLSTIAGELPIEIYDRLEQIYGFPMFNYEAMTADNADSSSSSGMSFDDLISSGEQSGSSSSSTPPLTDFNELLQKPNDVSVGLGDIGNDLTGLLDSTSTASSKTTSTKINAISNLRPFSQFRVLHIDPLVLSIDDFFTDEECEKVMSFCTAPRSKNRNNNETPLQIRSDTVGKDAQAKAQRTSTTWFNHYKTVPELMAKASRLLGLDTIDRWEEPQTVRYRRNEKFTWHLDALSPSESLDELGGQRIATLLVYHTDLLDSDGGATVFRDLGESKDKYLKVRPKKGSALIFFPAAGGIPDTPFDIRTLHSAEAVAGDSSQDKWISQLWLRQTSYTPTAPPGNLHSSAEEAVSNYCLQSYP